MAEIIPAILTNDADEFKNQLNQVSVFGAKTAQIDFVDGTFTDGKTLMPDDIDAFVLSEANTILEAHLMTEQPERYFATLYTLGFGRIAVHLEAISSPNTIIREIREYGMELGFAINPETPLEDVEPYINNIDFVLFMTVVPGKQGNEFEDKVMDKIRSEYSHELKEKHKDVIIEVDGGINEDTIARVLDAGADRIVIGSGIWKADNPKAAYDRLSLLASK